MTEIKLFLPLIIFFGLIFLVGTIPPEAFYSDFTNFILLIIVVVSLLIVITLLFRNLES